jgi:hypothetical protein
MLRQFFPVRVETHSGYKSDEFPVAFIYHNIRHTVVKVLDRWYEGGVESSRPTLNYFKVTTDMKLIALLRFNPVSDKWEICDF